MTTLSTVLTIITVSGATLDAGYYEVTTTQMTCADHIDIMLTMAAVDGAEADGYCLDSFTSMRPVARND
jgi:hypothetical protein